LSVQALGVRRDAERPRADGGPAAANMGTARLSSLPANAICYIIAIQFRQAELVADAGNAQKIGR